MPRTQTSEARSPVQLVLVPLGSGVGVMKLTLHILDAIEKWIKLMLWKAFCRHGALG